MGLGRFCAALRDHQHDEEMMLRGGERHDTRGCECMDTRVSDRSSQSSFSSTGFSDDILFPSEEDCAELPQIVVQHNKRESLNERYTVDTLAHILNCRRTSRELEMGVMMSDAAMIYSPP